MNQTPTHLIAIVLVLLLSTAQSLRSEAPPLFGVPKRVGDLNHTSGPPSFSFSPDECHFAFPTNAPTSGKKIVVFDGIPGPEVDAIESQELLYSSDSQRVAYVARIGTKKVVGADHLIGPAFDEIEGLGMPKLQFSPDSQHLAYVARIGERKNGRFVLVMDGVAGPPFDEIGWTISFGGGGKHSAYTARLGDQWMVVTDGQPGRGYAEVGDVVFSRDGKRVAYSARDKFWVAVVDGEEGAKHSRVAGLTFSPDGRHAGYMALDGPNLKVVVDNKTLRELEVDSASNCLFSPDGASFACLARKGSQSLLIVDDQAVGSFKGWFRAETMTFSPDGKRFACLLEEDESTQRVIVDGKAGPDFHRLVSPLVFSADSQRIAYSAASQTPGAIRRLLGLEAPPKYAYADRVIVDQQPAGIYETIGVGSPIFSPDGKHIAFVGARGGKAVFVVDGRESEEYDKVRRFFFDAENRFIFASKRQGKWMLSIGGQPSQEFDGIEMLASSPDLKHIVCIAKNGGKEVVILDGQIFALPEGYTIHARDSAQPFQRDGSLEFLVFKPGERALYRLQRPADQ